MVAFLIPTSYRRFVAEKHLVYPVFMPTFAITKIVHYETQGILCNVLHAADAGCM